MSSDARARDVDERQYTEGPVTVVGYLRVEYGHFEEYIDWLNSIFKPTMEATKEAGIIIDYKIFTRLWGRANSDISPIGRSSTYLRGVHHKLRVDRSISCDIPLGFEHKVIFSAACS
jgi:hypothetical protein